MKIVYMGTPEFAIPSLERLNEKYDVALVVTQPDKQKGRGKKEIAPPVKEFALKNGIRVVQPQSVRTPEFVGMLREIKPDAVVVAAFGKILPQELLDLPRLGCINVHGSLLPKYRGAAPIQRAIINGETATGITIMYMNAGIDTGDMILKERVSIAEEDTYASLSGHLALVGADLLVRALEQIENDTAVRIHQNDAEATYAAILNKEDGLIDFFKTGTQIINLIRGLNPWPSAYAYYEGEMLKMWEAKRIELDFDTSACRCGEIVCIDAKKGFVVKVGDGTLLVTQIQGTGGKRMSSADYMRGHDILVGKILRGKNEN